MRKLILQMQMTLDGLVAGSDGEMDWMVQQTDPKQLEILDMLTQRMDTILMGRKMSEGFCSHWEGVAKDQPYNPEAT